MKGKALFNGDKEQKQIQLIYELCGTPSEDEWEGVSKLPFWNELGPRQVNQRKLNTYLTKETQNRFPASLIDLIDKFLHLNPNGRLSIADALKHEFFTEEPLMSVETDIPLSSNKDSHEFVVRAENRNKKIHEYKKFYTFKHNQLLNQSEKCTQ